MAFKKFTSYKKSLPYLFDLERAGIKYDLKNIKALLSELGDPHLSYKTIHIAGTNGKGSVSSMMNSFLMEAGFKTGLYTSPHVKDFRERMIVNGKLIPASYVLDFLNRTHKIIKKIQPSFFEVTTAMAFDYFRHKKVDYAVIETGLGGRLDSTNVVKPELTIITSIGIDHVEFLGNTIPGIAWEKAGIIKKGVPCITGKLDEASYKVIEDVCKKRGSKLIRSWETEKAGIVKRDEGKLIFNLSFDRKKVNAMLPIAGDYQIRNIRTSLAAIKIISEKENIKMDKKLLINSFKNIKVNSNFYGRFDLIRQNPKVIIDTSHNEQALKNLKDNLKYFKYNKLIVVMGMMKDKEIEKSMKALEKIKAFVILTKPNYKRAIEPEGLYEKAKTKNKYKVINSLRDSIDHAMETAGKKDLILITGSFFMAGEGLAVINKYY